ncbi:hypothetical protein [Ramlibacter montanisoli]|uniref:hypothetical protein n=1 Tax=Ramlibacter montanisoli TaxID=2732512 RepID=UPI001C0F11F5|nr:hypothetical protein [Ramlibacter montanisoli]
MSRLLRTAWLLCGMAAASFPQAQPARASVERSGDAIVFRGRIDEASAAAFRQLLRDPAVKRLVITSPGGLVAFALDMAEAIHARGLDLEVPEACMSSCANYIFPAARNKRLGAATAVGWHGNMTHVLYLQQAGLGRWSDAELAAARSLAQRETAFFARAGVDGFVCWFAKLPPHEAQDFYALSPQDMALFGIGNVSIDPAAPLLPAPGVRLVVAERAEVERARPVVRLEE